ncbi:2-dehydro-3-deoxygalactonokinase [Ferruginibacter paludis]|uniref:2-dehydro-3-deoxygalactonokinase n=1 Tax=Ferruginibacter paludis TaxID=1310417 RepID=UPI0025B4315B|nr:2-dehydro-3-deoxygalactonokinase [Ferruginibacter paludis]MDN3655082.1 2-dehydro-3-deoxygalactonokinase [Ferruginibacter paludis]
MKHFISCDWGTSSFRLRLIETGTEKVLAESRSAQGIAAAHASYKESGDSDRILFYTNSLMKPIKELEEQAGLTLDGVTVIISGMASSSLGMIELPYKSIPFYIKKAGLETHFIPATDLFRHNLIIVSGVRSGNDVMRGEETILVGCSIEDTSAEQLFIFPGTHSKHITVQDGLIINIGTYMTGELFDLLRTKSILAASVEAGDTTVNNRWFVKGVQDSVDNNVLNTIFHIRTNQLFGALNKADNYQYLSGLLIGAELKDLLQKRYAAVTIVSEGVLLDLYLAAMNALGLQNICRQQNADKALVSGQAFIFNHYL